MPRVIKQPKGLKKTQSVEIDSFPVKHYSASSLIQYSTNAYLFKLKYICKQYFDTASGISGVLGTAFHKAMEVYYGGSDTLIVTSEAEAIEFGLRAGMEFLESYNDGFINYSKTIPNKQKALDLLSFCFTSYIKEMKYRQEFVQNTEDEIEEFINVEWGGKELKLPVKLKGKIDRVDEENGKLKIIDYKTCYTFSNLDRLDGAKIIQAVQYYLLAYAKYGKAPYSLIYEEVKYTKNADGSPQVKQYEIVYSEHEFFFDFYFRIYEDITRSLNGESVYIPNVNALYDNEVAIFAYTQRLDDEIKLADLMKKHKVETITELLKKEIQSAGNMRKLMKTVEEGFVSAKNLNYDKMKNEEKIQTKLMEHGMMLSFDSVVNGSSIDLYRYSPSIGLKMSRIKGYTDDIEQVLGISGIRVLAPIPGSNLIGFEVPREVRNFPNNTFKSKDLLIGLDVLGNPLELKIEEMPHLLVAGTTGSGKSVFLNEIINQCTGKYDITIFDPKGIEFIDGIDDHHKTAHMLNDLVEEMKERYTILKKSKVKKWSETGKKSKLIIIDEYNDLFMSKEKVIVGTKEVSKMYKHGLMSDEVAVEDTVGNVVSSCVKKLAQKARSAGIHIVLATQRPSIKVLDGDIKANFPTRVSFRLPTITDSKVVLDQEGAEKLLGKGDGLLLRDGAITRFQAFKD